MYWIISLFIYLAPLSTAPPPSESDFHKFHVSKCQIAYNQSEQALQMSFHIFIDDLEAALRKRGADHLYIATEKEVEGADEHLYAYLKDKFILQVNKQEAAYEFIGKEVSEDLQAVWCYLEIQDVNSLQALSVSSEVLMDVHDDQKNIILIERSGHASEFMMLTQNKSSANIQFDE